MQSLLNTPSFGSSPIALDKDQPAKSHQFVQEMRKQSQRRKTELELLYLLYQRHLVQEENALTQFEKLIKNKDEVSPTEEKMPLLEI